MTLLELFGYACLCGGAAFLLLAALGLWRFSDLYARLHALTKADTAGVALVALGAGCLDGRLVAIIPLGLTAILVAVSGATTGHLIASAALGEDEGEDENEEAAQP